MINDSFKELFLDKIIYIDTNIFFDEDLRYLFEDVFDEKIYNIIIPEIQYNEIYRLKSDENDKKKSYLARNTMKIIENLIEKGIAEINFENKKDTYADPIFIKEIIENIKYNKPTVFLTNDTDLRIRLKNEANQLNINMALLNIVNKNDLQYIYLKKMHLIDEEEYEQNNSININREEIEFEQKEINYPIKNILLVGLIGLIITYFLFSGKSDEKIKEEIKKLDSQIAIKVENIDNLNSILKTEKNKQNWIRNTFYDNESVNKIENEIDKEERILSDLESKKKDLLSELD